MNKDILVTILEDDVFSRNWMALLLVRDWRTRLIGEFQNNTELCETLNKSNQKFDILIFDVDLFGDKFSIRDICQNLTQAKCPAKILLIGVEPKANIINQLNENRICGYVLKNEVGYSLSWFITFAYEDSWVTTPGVLKLANQMKIQIPENRLILDGRKSLPGFTDHETEVARLAFIFSLGRRDLADELKISEQWSYGLVSDLYKKMGLTDILSGEVDLFSYIGENEVIRKHFEEVMDQLGTSKKARDLEILAYHLITMPEILP